jgi:formylglycine-generating enzyme required for sulfatase activity
MRLGLLFTVMASLGVSVAVAQTPTTFQDCATCPRMVVIPAGSFVMGSPETEPDRDKDESPQRTVSFAKSFAISQFEVTRDQYEAFVRATGHASSPVCSIWADTQWQVHQGKTWRDPGFAQTGAHPVVCVNWDDAKAYVAWLAASTGQTYRLPSEAEWEYAARAGSQTPYFFGANPNDLCKSDNGRDLTSQRVHTGMKWPPVECDDGFAETAPVGSLAPNPYGVYDVHGNVWEWMSDCYADNYAAAPPDGAVVEKPACTERVYRGGGWSVEKRGRRAANRGRYAPTAAYGQLGIRVVKEIRP